MLIEIEWFDFLILYNVHAYHGYLYLNLNVFKNLDIIYLHIRIHLSTILYYFF